MSNKGFKLDPGPITSIQKKTADQKEKEQEINIKDSYTILNDNLIKLNLSLGRSFKPEFIDSISYLIKLEYQDQIKFDSNIDQSTDWSKLDYFMQQLKKISKNKTHLLMFTNKMIISNQRITKQPSNAKIGSKNSNDDDLNDLNAQNIDFLNLINDFSHQHDYFSLTNILVRLLFKLFKSKLNMNDFINANESLTKCLYNLNLILLSCIADLCHYEEIRIQVINDSNLKCLFEIFALVTKRELECNLKRKQPKSSQTVQLVEKFWSKMCRLGANLCQEKTAQRIKNLFTKEFMLSLCKCIDQQQAQLNTNTEDTSTELDLDLYHSLLRFIKYGCELVNCKKLLLESRILVYLCKYMFKLNKNILIVNENDQKSVKVEKAAQNSNVNSSETPSIIIQLPQKYYQLFKDIIKQFLIILDCWPTCSEFYNQIIEGSTIEYLLWLQTTESNNLNTNLEKTDKPENKNSSTSIFNYSEFSFNLMYKLCRDYHACRAEFGRVGGLSKYILKTDQMTVHLSPTINKDHVTCLYLKEYTMLIDILCLSCKESANRLRLKEQGYLLNLLKVQQKLLKNKTVLNKYFKTDETIEDNAFIDSTLYNKLLVGLCCFAHDQDSMNILLSNGLVDSLLGYLNEIIKIDVLNRTNSEVNFNLEKFFDTENRIFSLKRLLSWSSDETSLSSLKISKSNSRKRKTLDPNDMSNKPKRANSDLSSLPSSSPPLLIPSMIQPISNETNFDNTQATSPTESYLSLSPSLFMQSPPQLNQISSRCSSAQIFQGLSPNFYSSLSPTTSMNELAPSPTYFNFPTNEEPDIEYVEQMKFSPSINNESSNGSDSDANETIDEMEEDEDDNRSLEEIKKEESKEKEQEEIIENLNSSQSIESINHVEACVFYVLSQLSHGDKPSVHLLNNFESILVCLLNYLKSAKVRNPRALRILNRLTKNQYCFTSFILTLFPYKLKSTFYENDNKPIKQTKTKGFSRSKSLADLKLRQEKQESDIEKEMNIYLNSNKAFFDATSFFPSFESIEFTLINNLKMQCISSSDSGYLTLISLMKQRRLEKLSSALVAPFILRNSKALYYIMVQLNGIDLILDSIFTTELDEQLKLKSIFSINRILSFISYKRDLKQIKEYYDSCKQKLNNNFVNSQELSNKDFEIVTFSFNSDGLDRQIKANKSQLAKKSDYFNALLYGHFSSSNDVEIKEVSYDTFSVIVDLLKCRCPTDDTVSNGLTDKQDYKISFDICVDLIIACDRFFLSDLKEFFVSVLIFKFMSLSTFVSCFKLSWYLNCSFLANASVDFLLTELQSYSSDQQEFTDQEATNQRLNNFVHGFDCCLENLKATNGTVNGSKLEFDVQISNECDSDKEKLLRDYFRKTLRTALSEIIKNNYWKF